VKAALTGVLKSINDLLLNMVQGQRVDNSRPISLMLQTLYRLIPCVHGYKSFVEVKEVDTRILLLQLIKIESDFVNYWTLEVLMVLCRCPLNPRNNQQEFVNKHTLLTDHLLKLLIEMMSSRIDIPEEVMVEDETVEELAAEGDLYKYMRFGFAKVVLVAEVIEEPKEATPRESLEAVPVDGRTQAPKPRRPLSGAAVAQNASAVDHITSIGSGHADKSQKMATNMPTARRKLEEAVEKGPEVYFPNSLVVVAAAALLESIVSSQRDTSSPELMCKVLDLLCERTEVLVHMLRSNSFLIMENAAILMFVVLKNRPFIAEPLREQALSECLVLKHFYNGVFSPSINQRFISRFLIATWLAGSEKKNPGRCLLILSRL
jgi:hypothetical protein